MSEKPLFVGAATALITPFTKEGVDFTAMGNLIDWQIDEGIDALVVCGTTGEAPTLTDDEHQEIIAFTVKRVAGRVPVIAGVGSNDTEHAVMMAEFACEAGADGLLVVTPYYNKTTQRGLIRSYERIADASEKPLILYNVPSRTGVDILPETYAALADHPMIIGIKEASGNISRVVETMTLVGDRLDLYSEMEDLPTGMDGYAIPVGTYTFGGDSCAPGTFASFSTYFESDEYGGVIDIEPEMPYVHQGN